ncbi:MAG: hypothetical protein ACR2JK_02715 [Geodermatophilaceae bacterium]
MKVRGVVLLVTAAAALVALLAVAVGLGWLLEPAEWTALAALVTAATAVVAATIALLQLRHAQALRLELAQPYVVAYMDSWPNDQRFVDIVVRNFGSTIAKDVRIVVTPAARRSVPGTEPEDVWLPECIRVLVPGQEWRTSWDFAPERAETDLPDRHEAVIRYRDSQDKLLPATPSVLDWGAHKGRQWVTTYGLHDAAKALREINKTTEKWTNSIRGGIAVFVRDGDAADDLERTRNAERWRRNKDLVDKLLPETGRPGAAEGTE